MIRRPLFWALTALLFETGALRAQVQVDWVRRHAISGSGANQPVALALDGSGNVIIGGQGGSTNGDYDYTVVKYGPEGAVLWRAGAMRAGDDRLRSMAVDSRGNTVFTVTGVTARTTIKLDGGGRPLWTAPLGGECVAVDSKGAVYVVGSSSAIYSTVKLDAEAGTNVWVRTEALVPGISDHSQLVAVDSKDRVFVAGDVICFSMPRVIYGDRLTVSYDADGLLKWRSVITRCFYSRIRMVGLAPDNEGGVYEAAETEPDNSTVTRYNSSGAQEWQIFNSYVVGGLRAMAVDNEGSTYVTGRDSNVDTGQRLISTEKISPSGSHVWVAGYEAPTSRSGNALALDAAGNLDVAGQVPGAAEGNDYIVIKYSPDGRELWSQRYDGPAHGDDVATAIAVAPDGSVYVTGWSTTSSNLVEITTIKYSPILNITMLPDGHVQLQFPGAPGQSSRVQATTDFLEWQDLGFGLADTNGLLRFLDTNALHFPFRFYRTATP